MLRRRGSADVKMPLSMHVNSWSGKGERGITDLVTKDGAPGRAGAEVEMGEAMAACLTSEETRSVSFKPV